MGDPFSRELRKFIPWDLYQAYSSKLAESSLVGREVISHRDAQIRVEELERYEVAHGFVYAGEKKWLTSTCFHEGGRYSD